MFEGYPERQIAERLLKVRRARDDLIAFTELTMPDHEDPGNPAKSAYEAARHHRFMAKTYEEVARGEHLYTIVNAPPSHGKSELGTRRFGAWFIGRNPGKHLIIGTYAEQKAADFREELIGIIESPEYQQIFPDTDVVSRKSDTFTLSTGSRLYFVGRGNPITGRHAHLILIDDPIKDEREARSDIVRRDLWKWWTTTISTRRVRQDVPVVVTQTRWTEDDLTGRLSDPSNPFYSKQRGKDIHVVNLPALAEDDDPLGRKRGKALWPERFNERFMDLKREEDPGGFAALYQGRPTPEDGIFYTSGILDRCEYDQDAFPHDQDLRWYGASDHAVSTSRMNDFTCIMPFGVDTAGVAWISPDLPWARMQADEAVEHIVNSVKVNKPLAWYTAKGAIDAAIGPFLRRRMAEEQVYVPLHGFNEREDKMQRAHSARARVAQGKVRFPRYAPWWPKAKEQLLKFPNGTHADFVDTLSLLGLAVDMIVAGTLRAPKAREFEPGTYGYMLREMRGDPVGRGRHGW